MIEATMEEILLLIVVFVVTLVLDQANCIGGTAIGVTGRQGFFGTSWPLFLAVTVAVSTLSQAIYWDRWPGYHITVASVLTGYAICLGCALVFGAKVFKLTGNRPRT